MYENGMLVSGNTLVSQGNSLSSASPVETDLNRLLAALNVELGRLHELRRRLKPVLLSQPQPDANDDYQATARCPVAETVDTAFLCVQHHTLIINGILADLQV